MPDGINVRMPPSPMAVAGLGVASPAAAYGPWKSARVTDTGRPLGRPFTVGQRVHYRETLGADPDAAYHLFDGRTRRWVTATQLDGATTDHQADVPDAQQGPLNQAWLALEPKPAGFYPGTRIPLRYKGRDVRVSNVNPEVRGRGWQGDTVAGAPVLAPEAMLLIEAAVWVSPPTMPPPEVNERQIQDLLRHEAEEYKQKERLVDERWPTISTADRARCMDEMEGPAHALTIGTVEGYYGPDAERRYLVELDYAVMRQRGFGTLVDEWEKTDL